MKHLIILFALLTALTATAADKYDNPDTIVVARDGTGQFRNIAEAIEVCRAFMDYHKVIYIKNGTYKEKLVIPTHLTNIEFCGQDSARTVITWDDHANITDPSIPNNNHKIGTFRTYTVKVDGSDITFKDLTIENNSPRLGQAVSLHTEGDRLTFVRCRLLGHQDTVYTGRGGTTLTFNDCYIEGTTDFIFGPATAYFTDCEIHSKANSYITAASTPQGQAVGYVFRHCRLTAAPGVTQCYLGRPWRPYAHTLFAECEMGAHIRPEGWHDWNDPARQQTTRYEEYRNSGPGAATQRRAPWSHQLKKLNLPK